MATKAANSSRSRCPSPSVSAAFIISRIGDDGAASGRLTGASSSYDAPYGRGGSNAGNGGPDRCRDKCVASAGSMSNFAECMRCFMRQRRKQHSIISSKTRVPMRMTNTAISGVAKAPAATSPGAVVCPEEIDAAIAVVAEKSFGVYGGGKVGGGDAGGGSNGS